MRTRRSTALLAAALLSWWCWNTSEAFAQPVGSSSGTFNPPLTIDETDGSPTVTNPTHLHFGNGDLTVSGSEATAAAILGLADIDRLTSVTATAGDTLILTSNGTNATLTWSRAAADLLFNDSTGTRIAQLFDSSGTDRGLTVLGHLFVGYGTTNPLSGTAPSQLYTFQVASDDSDTGGLTLASMRLAPILDADRAGVGYDSGQYLIIFSTGFDPDSSASAAIDIVGHQVAFGGTVTGSALAGSVDDLVGFRIGASTITTPAGSPALTQSIGVDINVPNWIVGAASSMTRSVGLVTRAGSGTATWGIISQGRAQVTTTNRVVFGGSVTSAGTESIRRSAATTLTFEINSADEMALIATALYPTTNGGLGLGRNGNGWGDLWFLDTSAAFEDRVVFTSSTALTADRTLTMDMNNVSATLKFNAAATVTLDDWFDQNVKTTANVTFADLSTTGNTTIGNATTDTVRFNAGGNAAAPGTNAIGVILDYYGTSATRVLTTPNRWWSIIGDDGNTYRIPLYT